MEGKIKIRKNDTVEVIAGSEKGKRGAVLRVLPEKNQVIIQGINMGKKAMRKRSQQDQGGKNGAMTIKASLKRSRIHCCAVS